MVIIDDDIDVLKTAHMILKKHFREVITLFQPEDIVNHLKDGKIDVVLLDMNFSPGRTSGKEGIQWLKKIRETDPKVYVLMNTAYGDINLAVEAMKPVLKSIEKVAPTEAIVLLLGENGTGKELVAREIHRQSERRESQLVKVDLGAVPESLFESELFGHVKGAFTDARESRPGRF